MNEDLNLAVLGAELRALETDTFELVDYVDEVDMMIVSTNSTICNCSTCSSTTS